MSTYTARDESIRGEAWRDKLATWLRFGGYEFEGVDDLRDISVATILSDGNGCFFVVQPQKRWPEDGRIPFGCVGGKLLQGELPMETLLREVREELGPQTTLDFVKPPSTSMVDDNGQCVSREPLFLENHTMATTAVKIHRSGEDGRKITVIICYLVKVSRDALIHNLDPSEGENPALIYLPYPALGKALSVEKLRVNEIPDNGGYVVPIGDGSINVSGQEELLPLATPGVAYVLLTDKEYSKH